MEGRNVACGTFEQFPGFVSKVIVRLHAAKSSQFHCPRPNLSDGPAVPIDFQQAALAVAGGGRVFHGVAGHDDSEHGGAGYFGSTEGDAAQHEVGAGELHAEPGGVHSDQRVDGGPLRNAARVCVGDRVVHAGIFPVRHFEQHPFAGGVPGSAGLRRSDDGAGGPAHAGADVCQVRTDSRDQFCGDSGAGWTDAGADCGRADRGLPALAIYFFREHSDRADWLADGVSALAGLPRRKNARRWMLSG